MVAPVTRILTTGALALALTLSACSSGADTPATPSSTPPDVPARTAAVLQQALLGEADLPEGYSLEPKVEGDEATPVARSDDPSCDSFVRLINADALPGSKASALAAFSGGPQGPFVEEWLEAMGAASSVAAVQEQLVASVEDCSEVTVALPGSGAAEMSLSVIDAPTVGTNPVAYRMEAKGGALDGFEITFVHAGVGDTLLTMNFVAIDPAEIAGVFGAAHEKAAGVLKVA